MLILFATFDAHALPTPKFASSTLHWNPQAEAVCTESGLRVTIERDPAARTISLVSVVDAGRADEPLGQAGLAHLVEHLWFRGRAVAGGSVGEALDLIGFHNAFTEVEVTEFASTFPPGDLDRALAIEGLRFATPLAGVDEAMVATEREVVAREWASRGGDSFGKAMELIDARLFPGGHPYGRASLRRPEEVRQLTLAQVRAFVAQHYLPENTTLHLVGAVPEEELPRRLARVFPEAVLRGPGGVARNCASFGDVASEPPEPKNDAVEQVATSAGALDIAAWSVPGGWTDSAAVEAEADAALGWALGMYCQRTTLRLASRVVCLGAHLSKDPAAPPDLTRLERLAARSTQADYTRVWGTIGPETRRDYFFAAADWLNPFSSDTLLPFRANHAIRAGGWYTTQLARLAAADPREPFTYATRWFTAARAVRVVLRAGGMSPDESLLMHPEIPLLGEGIDVAPSRLADRLPDLSDDIRRERLDSGATVAVLPSGSFPIVAVEMVFAGGPNREPTPGLRDIVRHQEQWTPRNIGFDLNLALDNAGIRTERYDGDASHTFRWTGPTSALPDMLWTLRHRLGATELVDGRVDAAEVLATRLIPALQVPKAAATRLALERLFGADIEPNQTTWQHAQNTSFGKRTAFVNGLRSPSLATLNIVGGIEPDVAVAAAHAAFDTWPIPKAAVPPLNGVSRGPPPELTEGAFVSLGGTRSADLALVCPLGEAGVGVAEAIEAGVYTRLFAALRNNSGLTYTPWVTVLRRPDTGPLLALGATVAPQNTGEALHILRGVVRRFATDTDDAEARRMVLTAASRLDVRRASHDGLLDAMRLAALELEPELYFHRERAELLGLDGGLVRTRMSECLAHLSWAVAGHPEAFPSIAGAELKVKELTAREWVGAHVELPEGG